MSLGILVIDMQELYGGTINSGGDQKLKPLIANQVGVLRQATKMGIPVTIVEMSYSRSGETYAEIVEAAPEAKKHYKEYSNAFYCESGLKFANQLKENGIDTLFLMGVYADQCLLSTARGAREQGFTVVTNSTVISGNYPAASSYALEWFEKHGKLAKFEELI